MPVTLPRRGGIGRRGGPDGGRGRGGRGGSLPCRERNPVRASNSRNSTLTTPIPPSLALWLRQLLCPPLLLMSLGPSMLLLL